MPNYILKACQKCKKDYKILFKKRASKYCSRRCAYDDRTKLFMDKICICGLSFQTTNDKQKYCSRSCRKHTDETKKLFSLIRKGSTPWNKGKTNLDDDRILVGEKSPAFGKNYMTPETADKIKQSTKGKINLGKKNGMKKKSVRRKMSASRCKMLKSPEVRAGIAARTRAAWASGKFDGVKVGRCKWFKHTKKDGTEIKCQGTWELAFAKWADQQGLKFDTHCGKLTYEDKQGISRTYLPDFYVYDWNSWVDVKCDYYFNSQREKIDCIIQSNPKQNIKFLLHEHLTNLGVWSS